MSALIDKYTREELIQIVQRSHCLSQVIQKLGYSTSSGGNHNTVRERLKKYNIDCTHFGYTGRIKRTEENTFIENSTADQSVLRRMYKKGEYTPYKCSICGMQPLWRGKELTLILDHINGNNHDDRFENLRWVCPNCNQQLETTGFKQMRVKKEKEEKHYYCEICGKEISNRSQTGMCHKCFSKTRRVCQRPNREDLKKLIRTTPFVKIGEQYNVTDNAIRKWCIEEKLPKTKKEINKYSEEEWNLI